MILLGITSFEAPKDEQGLLKAMTSPQTQWLPNDDGIRSIKKLFHTVIGDVSKEATYTKELDALFASEDTMDLAVFTQRLERLRFYLQNAGRAQGDGAVNLLLKILQRYAGSTHASYNYGEDSTEHFHISNPEAYAPQELASRFQKALIAPADLPFLAKVAHGITDELLLKIIRIMPEVVLRTPHNFDHQVQRDPAYAHALTTLLMPSFHKKYKLITTKTSLADSLEAL